VKDVDLDRAKDVDVDRVKVQVGGREVRKDDFPKGYSDYQKDMDKNNKKKVAMSLVNNRSWDRAVYKSRVIDMNSVVGMCRDCNNRVTRSHIHTD
jgi:hypothetical protein